MATSERKLGRRTLAALVDALERARTDTNIRKLLFKHGLEERYTGKNIGDRLGNVFYPLVSQQRYEELSPRTFVTHQDYQAEVERAWFVIDEITMVAYENPEEYGLASSEQLLWKLRQGLRVDGYDLLNGRVVPFLSPSVEPAVEQGILESRLDALGLSVARTHLDQAVDNAARGNWESANAQLRPFLEGLCDAVTQQLHEGEGKAPTRGNARKWLAASGFFSEEESDLLKNFFDVLHGEGSHAGTSQEADCHRRRLMAFSLANYYLDRLEGWTDGT